MTAINNPPAARQFQTLLRGEADALHGWLHAGDATRMLRDGAVIAVGAGLYGAAMGWWRAPEQALFVAIKFPLIILLTTLGNALLNAMLAPLLGLNLTVRQSVHAVLMSFTISAAILGAFAPLTAFMVWNAPPLTEHFASSRTTYSSIQLAHVVIIAFAGIAGNARLFQLLQRLADGNRRGARRVMFAWLAGNLFLGSQLSWVLRPFIGSPHLPVQFFRAHAMAGGFFESVFNSFVYLFKLIFS
ncbi:MAG: hypothetical protein NTZ16_11715 [Verrucomicrobia bacterium]|nr:hypothetical protein [Verrucomicrobiota bacterium]